MEVNLGHSSVSEQLRVRNIKEPKSRSWQSLSMLKSLQMKTSVTVIEKLSV